MKQLLLQNFTKQFINGQWRDGASSSTIQDYNPYSGEQLLTIQGASTTDLDEAYRAAQQAQPVWEAMPLGEKNQLFERLVKVLEEKERILFSGLSKNREVRSLKQQLNLNLL